MSDSVQPGRRQPTIQAPPSLGLGEGISEGSLILRLSGSLGALCSKAAIWGSRREGSDIKLAPDFSSQKSLTLMMDLSPGGMRKLKEVHSSERGSQLDLPGANGPGERQVPGVSWGSLALSVTERLTPHLRLSSEICQEQNFHLAR